MMIMGFEFPEELYYLVEHQMWARLEEGAGTARVGITAMGVHLAGGEIYMARPKMVGTVVQQGASVGVVELAKAIVSVKAPLSGTVLEINPRLAAEPELVHREPFGAGWLVRMSMADFPGEAAQLVQGEAALRPAIERHAWLNKLDG